MGEGRLFLMVCSNSTRSNGLKLVHWKFHTNVQKNFFTVRVMEHWNRLPREAVESPFLEIFNTQLDSCETYCGVSPLAGVGLDLCHSNPCDSVIL